MIDPITVKPVEVPTLEEGCCITDARQLLITASEDIDDVLFVLDYNQPTTVYSKDISDALHSLDLIGQDIKIALKGKV